MAGLHAQGTYASGFDADMDRMADNVGVGDDGQCAHCGSYFEDDDMSSPTESDTGSYDADAAAYATVEVDGQTRQEDDARANALHQDDVMSRRPWRRYTGKPPRRYRRFGLRTDRGSRQNLIKVLMPELTPHSFPKVHLQEVREKAKAMLMVFAEAQVH